jgi:hypothetical protein
METAHNSYLVARMAWFWNGVAHSSLVKGAVSYSRKSLSVMAAYTGFQLGLRGSAGICGNNSYCCILFLIMLLVHVHQCLNNGNTVPWDFQLWTSLTFWTNQFASNFNNTYMYLYSKFCWWLKIHTCTCSLSGSVVYESTIQNFGRLENKY